MAKEEKKIGTVFLYYNKIGVAAIKLEGKLAIGDMIHIKGHTTDFKQKLESMQIDMKPLKEAKARDEVGIKVKDRVRPNDVVYKV